MTEGRALGPSRAPERLCVACRVLVPRNRLIRLVRTSDGEVVLDEGHRRNGRGAYVCRTPECVKQAARKGALQRALKRPVSQDLLDHVVALGTAAPEAPTARPPITST